MALYLTESDVGGIVSMPDTIRIIEEAFRELGQGTAINRPRQRVRMPQGVLQVMPAGLAAKGYTGFKYYTSYRTSTRFWFHLLDAKNGDLLAVMQADRLGQQRTGAASGVATKFLANKDAAVLGIIGSGWQAESQLEAICCVRSIRIGKCYGRDPSRRTTFASKMSERLGVEISAVDSPEEAIRSSDIVVTATSAREPVLYGRWLAAGTHVNAIGSNRSDARELDDDVIACSDLVAVDSVEQAKTESGDLIEPIGKGLLAWESVHSLGAIVAGMEAGRTKDSAITLFKSNGIATEDVALGAWVYERARERGIGREIDL